MRTLANDQDFNTLTKLTIREEPTWFESEQSDCMAPLLVVLARQPRLQILDLHFNDLNDEQEQQVRSALVYLDCSVFFTYEEYD